MCQSTEPKHLHLHAKMACRVENSQRKKERKKGGACYHSFGAAATQGDACSQVCAVVGDGTGGAVELQFGQVDVAQ